MQLPLECVVSCLASSGSQGAAALPLLQHLSDTGYLGLSRFMLVQMDSWLDLQPESHETVNHDMSPEVLENVLGSITCSARVREEALLRHFFILA